MSDVHQGPNGRQGRHLQHNPTVLTAVAAGGAIGAAGRYLVGLAWPAAPGAFPVSTLGINVLGCALIGVLMVLVGEVWTGHPLAGPFLGTGVLGGFTTFSTYAVDIQRLAVDGHVGIAFLSLAATPVGALLAVWTAAATTRRIARGMTR